jgi:replicative superfamily II helicase
VKCDIKTIQAAVESVHDDYLKQTLSFGIAMHHAGLDNHDRDICEELFVKNKVQIMIATSTLAWGVNFPARLVIIKGT